MEGVECRSPPKHQGDDVEGEHTAQDHNGQDAIDEKGVVGQQA